MDAAKAQVLFDITLLALGATALGLAAFAFFRDRDAEIGWHHHGNVWSTPYDRLDLIAAACIMLWYLLQVAAPFVLLKTQGPDALGGGAAALSEGNGPSPTTFLVLSAVTQLAIGAGLFSFASVLRGRDPVQLFGLNRLRPIGVIGWVAVGFPVLYGIFFIGAVVWTVFFRDVWAAGDSGLQETVKLLRDSNDVMLKATILGTAIIVAPLVEEFVFRGFLYAVLKRYSDRFFAAVISALVFSLVHGNIPGLVPLFALGLGLALAYELSGCLWVPIGLHAVFNAIQSYGILFITPNGGG